MRNVLLFIFFIFNRIDIIDSCFPHDIVSKIPSFHCRGVINSSVKRVPVDSAVGVTVVNGRGGAGRSNCRR